MSTSVLFTYFYPKWPTVLCRLQDHPHCGVVCGPHRTVRTAPALMGQKCPHSHNFRTVHLSPNFEKMLRQKILKKKNFFSSFFSDFFFPIRAQMNSAGADNRTPTHTQHNNP